MSKIVELYAWVYDNPDGEEGIIGGSIGGLAMPLITSKEHLAKGEHMRGAAFQAGAIWGRDVRLKRFIVTEVVETLECSCQTCS